MSGICDGRVVAITGAGNGIGRSYALAFAREGASVVVNDVGTVVNDSGTTINAAQRVVDEIIASGGNAVAHADDISSWNGAQSLIDLAVSSFDGIDVLVNNAGILRDRGLPNMSEEEWDAVMRVHLKGTFATTRHAAAYWRDRSKEGLVNNARIINTSSPSGLFGNAGQSNYGAAKGGIASFTNIASMELARFGVTVNAIAPTARTQLTEKYMGEAPTTGFDRFSADNIAPLVVWLGSTESSEVTGRVFGVVGGSISVIESWVNGPSVTRDSIWEPSELSAVVPDLVRKAAPPSDMWGNRPAPSTD
jgi:NAD(P)-dependent dehydrogenase (short-subunit alcohol dehydrogenase family)